ncbi:Golgi pH regulator B isoform X1 [Trachypithecus francoisi]|uniref:Golgi pH regulator B isoform X1 n=1 Tax=Trachypithecus francoisi TaxID=54180 RepID=UPI00141BED7F|nr:Golgi pH regulator B isoform X1 [Trachypithecus francoisi]
MSFLIDSSITITSQILFFGFGWLFFMRQLFKDYEIRQYVVQVIFSVTFAFSCTMFELIIFEILGVLNSSATLLCKVGPGQSEIAEELCQHLQ